MQLRSNPSERHKRIGFYPGFPNFDRFIDQDSEAAYSLYQALLYAGITVTHKVLTPWAIGYADVTDPTAWDDNGRIRCYWVTSYCSIEHEYNNWNNLDNIIFEQIIDI